MKSYTSTSASAFSTPRTAETAPRVVDRSVTRPATHLTRRGRLVVVLGLAALLFAAFSFGRTVTQAATSLDSGPVLTRTTVKPGETLWSVAKRIAPQQDPREVVEQIREVNGLPTAGLVAGQQLLLPVAA